MAKKDFIDTLDITVMNPEGYINIMDQTGLVFENMFASKASEWAHSLQRDDVEIRSMQHTAADKYEGTDLILQNSKYANIHLDPTLHMEYKDPTVAFKTNTGIFLGTHTVEIGIRVGNVYFDKQNKQQKFGAYHTPTIVIGTNMSSKELRDHDVDIQHDLAKIMPRIMDKIVDVYRDYNTVDPEQRKALKNKPLVANPDYGKGLRTEENKPLITLSKERIEHHKTLRQLKAIEAKEAEEKKTCIGERKRVKIDAKTQKAMLQRIQQANDIKPDGFDPNQSPEYFR